MQDSQYSFPPIALLTKSTTNTRKYSFLILFTFYLLYAKTKNGNPAVMVVNIRNIVHIRNSSDYQITHSQ